LDFRLSDEQIMLKESAERFVSGEAGYQHGKGDHAFARATWKSMAELGWLLLLIPEARGGLGGGAAEAALLAESFGRGRVNTPYISSAVIASTLLARADDPDAHSALLEALAAGDAIAALATEESASRYDLGRVATIAKARAGEFLLSGEKIVIQDGGIAEYFLVSALHNGRLSLFVIAKDAPALTIRRYRLIDRASACDLTLANVPAKLVIADAAAALEHVIDQARLLLAAEALGCMEAALAITAEYLKTRKQFGRTLSSFQALTHRVADCYVKCEQLRSMLLRALSLIDADREARAAAVSAAIMTAIEAGEFVCGQAIQLHGGIGMTEEYIVGHFYKRVRAIGRTYGDLAFHRRRHIDLTQRSA
jgi:alkylation response protein AidB-like acyl-CoA dehydrogenase